MRQNDGNDGDPEYDIPRPLRLLFAYFAVKN